MFKKILTLILALAIALAMFACGNGDDAGLPAEDGGAETNAGADGAYEGATGS